MKTIQIKTILLLFVASLMVVSCKTSDADIQKAITEKMNMPEMTTSVTDGVVTLSGECKDEECKASCEKLIKEVKGVKSVINNCTIPAPVIINPDEILTTSVTAALSNYPGVMASVADGVVTLTGEVSKSNLMPLMQSVQELQPKKVVNNLKIN